MIAKLFWFFAAFFLGVATHLATVIFLPSWNLNQNIARLSENKPSNVFFLANPSVQSSLLSFATESDIVGMCQVDVENGAVVLSAKLPSQLWTLVIYDQSGQQIYGINDIDAGTEGFSVELSKTKSLFEQLFGVTDVENATTIRNIGWRAQLAQNKALAILWMPVSDNNRRHELIAAMNKVSCQKM